MPRITDDERERFHKYLDAAIDKLNSPKNCKKTHWSNQGNGDLLEHLEDEINELADEIHFVRNENIIDECNDVINIAMMIIDNNRV